MYLFLTNVSINILFYFYFFVLVFFTDILPKIEVTESNLWFFKIKEELEKLDKYGLVYMSNSKEIEQK